MAQIDANATPEQLEQMEREFALKRAAAARRRASELARMSEERVVTYGSTLWSYVVVDGSFARITSCRTSDAMLVIPERIDGMPVREIGAEACSKLDDPQEIICPSCVENVGAYAFRSCENLRRLVLPASTNAFAASWVSKCIGLEELVLPDELETVTADVLANPAVRKLVIGGGTRSVQPGAFEKTQLDTIVIDSRNPYLKTDGTCIYTANGAELVALAKPVGKYAVADGCRRIGEKAFVGVKTLQCVKPPEGLELIGPFAFAHSGLASFDCPSSLTAVGAKAFLRCTSLRAVGLNEGLKSIGEEAFAGSALENVSIPSTVTELGRSITQRSNIQHSGDHATFSIASGNEAYAFDKHGCLYARCEDGLHLMQMLEPHASSYQVREGTVAVDDKAFAFHDAIESVGLPQGLKRIGAGAFKVCRKLREITVPESLESVGADAFIDSSLERFDIPARLVDIGRCALVTDGAHHEFVSPTLRTVVVDSENPRFFMHDGMLCRRKERGVAIVVFTNSSAHVDFPEEVEEVEDYAFNNAFGIQELHLNARLRTIGACGLSVECAIRRVRIDLAKPIEGRSTFLLLFPETSRSVHGFLLALGGLGHLYMPDIMAQYDNCIAGARDYRASNSSDNASAYEQVQLIIGRLRDSVLLTESNRKRYRSLVMDNIEEICVDIARHDDRKTLADLADLGLLGERNLEGVIVAVGRLQDASMTGFLLELKRLRFGGRAVDFDL